MGRARRAVGAEGSAALESLAALLISALTALVAGLTLAGGEATLEELPGLLLLVPAAIALRGNVFGALGSRLGTAIHTGQFRLSVRPDSLCGQNVIASMVLSFGISVLLAVLAKGVAIAYHISPSMSLADFVVVSTVGGMLASVLVGVITLALAAGSVRFRWDLDNVTSPLVTAAGDVVTVPALIIAANLAGVDVVTPVVAGVVAVVGVAALGVALVTRIPDLRHIVRESVPVLLIACLLDLIAGITVESRLDELLDQQALLVLLPGFLGTAGSLGGILSSRLGTKFHLGLDVASPVPSRSSWGDIGRVFLLAVPVFVVAAVLADLAADATGRSSPGAGSLVGVALLGGALATAFVVLVAYYTTMAAFRFGLDPDTHGIPVVTSSLDLVGAFTFILAIVAVGVA